MFRIPLSQQSMSPEQITNVLQGLKLEVKETSNKTGFLMNCPKCQRQNLLFYSFAGKIFICLDYKGCKSKFISFMKLKKALKR